MNFIAYPLQFKPILKHRIWGGSKLNELFNKNSDQISIGESWELSAVKDDISIISNGLYNNLNLQELINKFPTEILGTKVFSKFGNEFPLLFKFIDAKEDLSIQVHPNDELAKIRHNSFGKTEMWYIIQADDNSRNIIGFKKESTPKEYINHLKNNTLLTILEEKSVKKGDVFFLETGTVHAIGKGIVLAEIQQTSDITYRIYDWDRKDNNGNPRELHLDLALEAINYNPTQTEISYTKTPDVDNIITTNKYFTVNFIPLKNSISFNKDNSTFRVYMCTDGNFSISYKSEKINLRKGDTILIPSVLSNYVFNGKAEILEIYI